MPPVIKKIAALIVMFVLLNVGFVWYGQASFDATFQSLAKAFTENNASITKRSEIPTPIRQYLTKSNIQTKDYRTILIQLDGTYKRKPTSKAIAMHALALLRATPDMLWAVRLDANPLITFNALETYHAAHSTMQMLIFGIIPTGEYDSEPFARSELARILAYGLFNPLLLACDCITYEPEGEREIRATIHDGNLTASVTLVWDENGEIRNVYSDDRVRSTNNGLQPSRWQMRILEYGDVDGIRLPREVEESWIVDGSAFVYARYTLTSAKRL